MEQGSDHEQPASKRVARGLEGSSSKALVDLAWAEWETIQKKIESVSTFPFTIKTWAVAIAAALLGLGKGFNFPPESLFAAALVPILFWAIEGKHHRMREILGRRALQIEVLIGRLVPIEENSGGSLPKSLLRGVKRLPGVGLAIQRADEERDRERYSFRPPQDVKAYTWAARNVRVLWHKYPVKHADGIFYSCQLILVLAIASSLTFFPTSSPSASTGIRQDDAARPTSPLPVPGVLKPFPENDLNAIFNADTPILRNGASSTMATPPTPR